MKKNFFNKHRTSPLYYWKNSQGLEVDLVIEKLEKLIVLEIKSSKTFNPSFLKNLTYFYQFAQKDIYAQYLIYGGESQQGQKMGKTQVLSWKELPLILGP